MRTVLHHCFGLLSGSIYKGDLGGNRRLEQYVGHIEHHQDGKIYFPQGNLPLIKTHELPHLSDAIYVARSVSNATGFPSTIVARRAPIAEFFIRVLSGNAVMRSGKSSPAIYVVRNGRAATLSIWQFYGKSIPIERIIAGQLRLSKWHRHLGTWSDHLLAWKPWERPNTILIRYEDITDNLIEVIDRLARFLKREPIANRIPPRDDIADVDGRWVRKERQRKEAFPTEFMERFQQYNGPMMKRLGYSDL